MKTYGRNLTDFWRLAGEALRKATGTFIIGYSLPEADSAALSLLVTNCNPNTVEIVNSDAYTHKRLSALLTKKHTAHPIPLSFGEWVNKPKRGLIKPTVNAQIFTGTR